MGEIMRAAMPNAFLLESETIISLNPSSEFEVNTLKDDEQNGDFSEGTSTYLFTNIAISHRKHSKRSTGLTIEKSGRLGGLVLRRL